MFPSDEDVDTLDETAPADEGATGCLMRTSVLSGLGVAGSAALGAAVDVVAAAADDERSRCSEVFVLAAVLSLLIPTGASFMTMVSSLLMSTGAASA